MSRFCLLIVLLLPCLAAAEGRVRLLAEDPVPHEEYPPAIEELAIESDGSRMPGLIYLANGPGPHPTIVLLHGIPGNEKNLDIAQVLRRSGYNVMFFHYRGAWGAEGRYTLAHIPEDVAAALAFLRQPDKVKRYRVDTDHLSLLGHSLGGWAALAAGSRDAGLTCVGAMSPANLGIRAEGLTTNDHSSKGFLAYADTLYMLAGMDSAAMAEQLSDTPREMLDTRLLGPGLLGKSVFMVVGEQDSVTPAAVTFTPTVEAYQQEEGFRLRHHIISGDHSFSWSRVRLTAMVLNWLQADCRPAEKP